MTQSELARRGSLREQQINRWERGHNVPSADAVGVLASALGCDVAELFVDGDGSGESEEDDEESELLAAAHALELHGDYAMANRLRLRAKARARARTLA